MNRDTVPSSEFSNEFVQKMKNAMEVSYYKYGTVSEAYPHKVDAVSSLMLRVAKYQETGNSEYLVDAANFAMIEFMLPSHKEAHYKAEDSDKSPGRISRKTMKATDKDNRNINANPGSMLVGFIR